MSVAHLPAGYTQDLKLLLSTFVQVRDGTASAFSAFAPRPASGPFDQVDDCNFSTFKRIWRSLEFTMVMKLAKRVEEEQQQDFTRALYMPALAYLPLAVPLPIRIGALYAM